MKFMATIALLCWSLAAGAQTLPRRPFLGIQTEKMAAGPKDNDTARKGLLISRIIDGSTAMAAGLKKGDVLLSINNRVFTEPAGLVQFISSLAAGSELAYRIARGAKIISGSVILKPSPRERYSDLIVIYTDVHTPSGIQRAIITKPKNARGRLPAVVFLTGIGCYSLDMPLDTARSELQLLNALARAGYMTIRIEKPGVGDGAGHSTPCNEVGFNEEVAGYAQAIRQLKQRADVQAGDMYIFGHSMGGVMAPLVAAQEPVKGIIAYGTIGSNFLEYLTKTRRTVGAAYEMQPDSLDDFVRTFCECAGYYFAENMTTAEAAQKNKDCQDYLSVFDLRSRQYNREMYAINIPDAWKTFTGNALLLWGESDFISAREDHQIIAGAINYYHPDHATFLTCPGATHGMQYASGFAEAVKSPGAYNPAIAATVLQWLKNDEERDNNKHG